MGPGNRAGRLVRLSHILSSSTPAYPGTPGLVLGRLRSIREGEASNSSFLALGNHLGTHADAPLHFDDGGSAISDFAPEELFFERAAVLDLPKADGELIEAEELRAHEALLSRVSFIMLRTGFQRFREASPQRYANSGPCLSSSAAEYLARFHPRLRALGVDAISVSSPLHREEGRRAHRALLRGRKFLIVEDMDLQGKPSYYRWVFVAPLMVLGLDGAPCYVVAEPEDGP
jgi:arylformamidase